MPAKAINGNIIGAVLIFLYFLTFSARPADLAFASATDGTVDSVYKYAWSENAGWVNFGCDNCNVHITDSGLTGYGWSDNYGWINLNATSSGVTNNGEGQLSGYGWGENLGWINFSGVTIGSSGNFSGMASGTVSGRINFDCSGCQVKTDWRPQSVRTTPAPTPTPSSGGGGGGGLPPEAYSAPRAPEGGFKILINDGALETGSRNVVLALAGGQDARAVWISESPRFPEGFQASYNSSLPQVSAAFTLSEGGGAKTVYAKFCTQWGRCSEIVSDSIIYKIKSAPPVEEEKPIAANPPLSESAQPHSPPPEITPPVEVAPVKGPLKLIPPIFEKIPEFLKSLLPGFLKPKPPEDIEPPEIPIEELVSKEAPLTFQAKWRLLPSKPIEEFVLAPLPKEIRKLAEKFPTLERTFEEVGVGKITDVEKLRTVKLTLPGLTERIGIPTAKIEPGKLTLPAGVPLAKLSPEIKKAIPSEIVFAKTGGELIDFNIALSVSDKGEPQQKISTISGKPLQLAVKPDKPVKSVKGYVVFRAKRSQPKDLSFRLQDLLASAIFALPSFTKAHDPVDIETRLVLLEFEYTDPDGDGIYTAEIQSPQVEGEYEIITVMDFDDPELGKKEIRLIAVVDPEGYVFAQLREGELRISGAVVSLFWLNPESKQYELWPAKEYQQENPQITDDTGKYSFLAPPGVYYLKVEHPKYPVYQSETFTVKEGLGVHINIELKTKYWWLKVDWRTGLLILVVVLLLYNFWRDKMRERALKIKT